MDGDSNAFLLAGTNVQGPYLILVDSVAPPAPPCDVCDVRACARVRALACVRACVHAACVRVVRVVLACVVRACVHACMRACACV